MTLAGPDGRVCAKAISAFVNSLCPYITRLRVRVKKNVQNCAMMRIVLLGLDVNGNWREAFKNQPYGILNRTMESRDYSKPVCAIVPLDLSRRP
jgi:hypothetical protein